MNQGGNYWTLFTPGIWKVLHAVFQTGARHVSTKRGGAFLRIPTKAATYSNLIAATLPT